MNSKIKSFSELLDQKYGNIGKEKREEFEHQARLFFIGELLKEARKKMGMTQEELANRIGSKKSYVSRVENGKADIQISSFFRIVEQGLGKNVLLRIL